MAETKEKTNNVVGKTLAYFMPIAWKHYKGFFFCGVINLILYAAQPFVSIIMTPLIIDELLGGRDIGRLLAYVAVIIVGGTFLSLLGSITDVVIVFSFF